MTHAHSPAPPHPGGARITALVAEDNSVNQMLVRHMLSRHGIGTTLVADGAAACAAAAATEFPLIVMDLRMPVMDGLEAIRRIRALEQQHGRKPAWILVITANAFPADRQEAMAAGANAFLAKPVLLGEMDRALHDAGLVS